jgi:D-alanyl-D-alanine carboxypeptidase
MRKIFLIAICILILTACKKAMLPPTGSEGLKLSWQDSSDGHPRNQAFKKILEKYNRLGLPGIGLMITDKNGSWIGSAGKADLKSNVDFAPTQVAKIASVTKFMMGALVFKMMEDSIHSGIGYSALDKKITTWLPEGITKNIANGNKVSLGELMNHESGIPDLIEQDNFYLAVLNHPNKKWSQEELLKFISGVPAVFKPGDTAIYSNTNTLLVSMILEKISGRNHADLLREKIFNPLGMHNTFYHPHENLPASVAQGYYDLYRNHTLVNVSNFITGSGNGYGGVYSNITDMSHFLDAVLIHPGFLSQKSLQLMQRYGKSDGANRYGYGLMKKFISRGENAGLGHSGRDLGYTADLFYFPSKGVSLSLLVNYGTDADSFLKEVFVQFENELLDLLLN